MYLWIYVHVHAYIQGVSKNSWLAQLLGFGMEAPIFYFCDQPAYEGGQALEAGKRGTGRVGELGESDFCFYHNVSAVIQPPDHSR